MAASAASTASVASTNAAMTASFPMAADQKESFWHELVGPTLVVRAHGLFIHWRALPPGNASATRDSLFRMPREPTVGWIGASGRTARDLILWRLLTNTPPPR
jgi:hypothetical protein